MKDKNNDYIDGYTDALKDLISVIKVRYNKENIDNIKTEDAVLTLINIISWVDIKINEASKTLMERE